MPLLVGNVFQQLYSTVDAIMLGNFVGDYALAAVGTTIPLFFLIMLLMTGVAMGAGVMVSQYFGAKQREELSYTCGTCITLTAMLGLALMIIGPIFTRPMLIFLGTPPEILNDATLYMNILLWGVLGMGYFNIFSGALRGMGDAFSPLLYLALASLLNIALNFLFIGLLGWGVAGAAVGTVISQAFTSVLCLRRLMQMRDVFDMGLRYLRPQKKYLVQMLKLGVPTGVSQAIFAIAMMAVQPLANSFGPTFLATYVIVMRVDSFVMMPNFSFSNSMSVYAGQNMGAGKLERIAQGFKQCSLMALSTAVVIVALLLTFGGQIAGWFTQTEEVLAMTAQFLAILAAGYVIFSVGAVGWGAIRGAGDAITPLWASIIITAGVRVPSAYLFVHWLGTPVALAYSLLAGWTANTILALIAYRLGKWRKTGIVRHEQPQPPE
ncbi:MAG: MATE family efflux transporter [Oscillospiraceae bacterium]|nr:MATE family efflux transporter [Oscillospiraceae bacterium]